MTTASRFSPSDESRELLVAVVTRCWETDLAALSSVLRQAPANLRYLGLLGSRRKVRAGARGARGRAAPLAAAPFFAPVGVPIGADSPAEIAVSILAEIIGVRSGKLETPRQAVAAVLPA